MDEKNNTKQRYLRGKVRGEQIEWSIGIRMEVAGDGVVLVP